MCPYCIHKLEKQKNILYIYIYTATNLLDDLSGADWVPASCEDYDYSNTAVVGGLQDGCVR